MKRSLMLTIILAASALCSINSHAQENEMRFGFPSSGLVLNEGGVVGVASNTSSSGGSGDAAAIAVEDDTRLADFTLLNSTVTSSPYDLETTALYLTDNVPENDIRLNGTSEGIDFEINRYANVSITIDKESSMWNPYFMLESLSGGPILDLHGQHIMTNGLFYSVLASNGSSGYAGVRTFSLGDLSPGAYRFRLQYNTMDIRSITINQPLARNIAKPDLIVTDFYTSIDWYGVVSSLNSGVRLTDGQTPNSVSNQNFTLREVEDYIEFELARAGEIEFWHRMAGTNYRSNNHFLIIPEDPAAFIAYTGVTDRTVLSTGATDNSVPSEYKGEYVYAQGNSTFTGVYLEKNDSSLASGTGYISTMTDLPAGKYRLILANPSGTNALTTILEMRYVN